MTTPDAPAPALPEGSAADCPLCHRLVVHLTPAGRFGQHRELLRPSRTCRASGLHPADLA